jgi:ABC-2 type transport system ATP-binding protein
MKLQIVGVKKKIAKKEILKGVTFSVETGEIVGLLGNNGAGKTTLIKCLMNAYKYEGMVRVDSINLKKNNLPKIISYSLEPSFYPHMTASENLSLLNIFNSDIGYALKIAGLEKNGGKKVKDFSFGMKQRLGLAQALLSDSKFIILDEPTIGIDPKGLVELEKFLTMLAKEYGKGILFSSHEINEVKKLCSRAVFLKNGKVEKEMNLVKEECLYDIYIINEQNNFSSLASLKKEMNCETKLIVPQEALNATLRNLSENNIYISKIEPSGESFRELYE